MVASPTGLYAVVEFLVHFEKFSNIDLFRQGLYHVRARIYTETQKTDSGEDPPPENLSASSNDTETDPDKNIDKLALPYFMLERKSDVRVAEPVLRVTGDEKEWWPPTIDNQTNHYCSLTFRVQYCEQETPLNNACLFRLELPADGDQDVVLEFDLMLGEYSSADFLSKRPPPVREDFKVVATKRFALHDVTRSAVHVVQPVVFDSLHFSVLHCLVHTMLLDYRFRTTQRQLAEYEPNATKQYPAASPVQKPPPSPPLNKRDINHEQAMITEAYARMQEGGISPL